MLQRIGDADLFGSWPIIGASRAVGQVSSRLCPLPELFAFPSPQICASDFLLQPSCDSCWNSTILLSSALAAETLLRSEIFSELHNPKRPSPAAPQFMLRGTYPASQLRAFSSSLGGKNFTGARRTPAPAKASASVSQRDSATMAILEILPLCKKRKSRSFPQSAPRSQPLKVFKNDEQARFRSHVNPAGEGVLLCGKFGSFQNA